MPINVRFLISIGLPYLSLSYGWLMEQRQDMDADWSLAFARLLPVRGNTQHGGSSNDNAVQGEAALDHGGTGCA